MKKDVLFYAVPVDRLKKTGDLMQCNEEYTALLGNTHFKGEYSICQFPNAPDSDYWQPHNLIAYNNDEIKDDYYCILGKELPPIKNNFGIYPDDTHKKVIASLIKFKGIPQINKADESEWVKRGCPKSAKAEYCPDCYNDNGYVNQGINEKIGCKQNCDDCEMAGWQLDADKDGCIIIDWGEGEKKQILSPHDFLISKGVKSMGETYTAFTIEQWIKEYANQFKNI